MRTYKKHNARLCVDITKYVWLEIFQMIGKFEIFMCQPEKKPEPASESHPETDIEIGTPSQT